MPDQNRPVHKESTSIELPIYMRAIEENQDHPVVKSWFHQITPCQLRFPEGSIASFLMIEFRDGKLAAMVWQDGEGNWGTGGWRPISSKTDTIAIDIGYMQGALAAATFPQVLEMVAARRREAPEPPSRPRWKFWGS